MLNQIPLSRRLALLLSGIWLFLSGIFSSVIGADEFFPKFDAASGFLVTWLFVGMMPLGLVWGSVWVISGYRVKRSQEAIREPESSESEIDQRHAMETHLHIHRINYHQGFWQLWIICTAAWYFYVFISSGHQIGEWVGFHYSLLAETKSFTRAAAEKRNYVALVAACNKAQASTCWVSAHKTDPTSAFPDRKYLPGCEQTQAYRDILSNELMARGVSLPAAGARGEACPDILATGIPEADWAEFSLTALAPFFLMLIYLIGRWIIKGFVRRFP